MARASWRIRSRWSSTSTGAHAKSRVVRPQAAAHGGYSAVEGRYRRWDCDAYVEEWSCICEISRGQPSPSRNVETEMRLMALGEYQPQAVFDET